MTQDLADPGFVAIAIERVQALANTSLTMFRTHALKLFSVFVSHARGEKLRIHPTLLGPGWPGILLGGSMSMSAANGSAHSARYMEVTHALE